MGFNMKKGNYMQVNQISNGTTFTSVIPVKVIANGKEVLDEETVRKTCNAVIRAISGPIKDNPNPAIRPAAATLNTMDPDYCYFRAYAHGYLSSDKNSINSDYFKTIIGKHGGYIVTGQPVGVLNQLGHDIGKAKRNCRLDGMQTSKALQNANDNYFSYIQRIGSNISLRIREAFNHITKERYGKEQQMEVYVTTKQAKQNGVSKVVIKNIDNIKFSDRPKFTKTS